MVKPLCAHQRGGLSEVAAWRLACLLGWTDLVPTTVLRSMRCPTHDAIEMVAAIINIESREDFPDMSEFSEVEIWKAAILDYVIAQTDRGGRTNYLGVPANSPNKRLVLIDNSFTFGANGNSTTNSQFRNAKLGQEIPRDIFHDLETLRRDFPDGVADLLHPDQIQECRMRVEELLSAGRMP